MASPSVSALSLAAMVKRNLAATKMFIDAAVDPKGAPSIGVPDGANVPTTIVRDQVITAVPSVGSSSFACAAGLIYPSASVICRFVSALGAGGESGTFTWGGGSNATNYSAMETNFLGQRLVGLRYRIFPTSSLSSLNGTFYMARIPQGLWADNSQTDMKTIWTTPDNLLTLSSVKTCPVDNPLDDGWTDFFVGSQLNVGVAGGGIDYANSYGFVLPGNQGNANEGLAFMWVGTASAGVVQNDPGLRIEINSTWECLIDSSNPGLFTPVATGGDAAGLARALEALRLLHATSSPIWRDNQKLLAKISKMELSTLSTGFVAENEHARAAMMQRRAHQSLKWLVEHKQELGPETQELLRQVLPEPSAAAPPLSDTASVASWASARAPVQRNAR